MNTQAWIKLKEYILTKNSHGKNELLEKMVNIEIEEINSIHKADKILGKGVEEND